MTSAEKKPKTLRLTAIGGVAVTKSPAPGPPNQVNVKVVASNVTVPFGPPSTCSVASCTALLERKSGTAWVYEAGPQPMNGNISTGFDTTFPPRANGDFRATVTIAWNISHPESVQGLS